MHGIHGNYSLILHAKSFIFDINLGVKRRYILEALTVAAPHDWSFPTEKQCVMPVDLKGDVIQVQTKRRTSGFNTFSNQPVKTGAA